MPGSGSPKTYRPRRIGQAANDAAAALEARYSDQDLSALIKNKGLEPGQPTPTQIQS